MKAIVFDRYGPPEMLRVADIPKPVPGPGEQILIIGAGGSIGLFAVMMAKALGARVTAVDKGEKLEPLLARRAVKALDFTRGDCFSRAERYDVEFSTAAHTLCTRALALLKRGGRYVAANPIFADRRRRSKDNVPRPRAGCMQ